MTTLNIISRHSKLSEAVIAAGVDLSYNEPLARADLARDDRDAKITETFVVSNATTGEVEVWYRYNCDIQLLNKYSPFIHCLRDGNFSPVAVKDHSIEIGEPILRRSMRKQIGQHGFTVALP